MDNINTIEAGGNMTTKVVLLSVGVVTGGINMEAIDLVFSIILKGISILSFTAALVLSCLTIYSKYIKK